MTFRASALCFVACLAAAQACATGSDAPGAAQGVLDGKVFVATINVDQYDTPFDDRMIFEAGTFLSEECQRRCNFGSAPYFTRTEGDSIVFVTEMVCKNAPQTVRFKGQVTGDRIEGTVLWKVERFYWTVERNATFTGQLEPGAGQQAATLTE